MNLKIGQKLKYKNGYGSRTVLEVLPNIVILDEFMVIGIPTTQIYTLKEIQEAFEIPEEEWEPTGGGEYWLINSQGKVESDWWSDGSFDNGVKNFLGIYRTKEDAQKALEYIKNKLGK